jgi:hypothetical protein
LDENDFSLDSAMKIYAIKGLCLVHWIAGELFCKEI